MLIFMSIVLSFMFAFQKWIDIIAYHTPFFEERHLICVNNKHKFLEFWIFFLFFSFYVDIRALKTPRARMSNIYLTFRCNLHL